MATVLDVAAYILERHSPITTMKLQKLCYYAQAWSLVWDDKPLFDARIEAWANGPVIPALYGQHRQKFEVCKGDIPGNPSALSAEQCETVDSVLGFYGRHNSHWLSELTHAEAPWLEARKGLQPGQRGTAEITQASMAEYYGSL